MKIKIQDIAYTLPKKVLTNEVLQSENPLWNFPKLKEKGGVESRKVAEVNETALDLAYEACNELFEKNAGLKDKIDGLLFCTQSPDYIMPSNSCLLHGLLNLKDEVFATDYNLACSGYVYGLTLARGLIASGVAKNVLLVTADTYSKYIHEKDRSIRVIFGDGAAVSWIKESEDNTGIVDILCATTGKDAKKFMIPAGGTRLPRSEETAVIRTDSRGNSRSQEHIHMDGPGILDFVKDKVPKQIQQILVKNSLSVKDIDLFVFHQASKMALDFLGDTFELKAHQKFSNLEHIGNTVSASIPIALKDAIDQNKLKAGDKILLVGFGVGLSYATALMSY